MSQSQELFEYSNNGKANMDQTADDSCNDSCKNKDDSASLQLFIEESVPLMHTSTNPSVHVIPILSNSQSQECLLIVGNCVILRQSSFDKYSTSMGDDFIKNNNTNASHTDSTSQQRVIAYNQACRGFVPNCLAYHSVMDVVAFVRDRSSSMTSYITLKRVHKNESSSLFVTSEEEELPCGCESSDMQRPVKFICIAFSNEGYHVGAIGVSSRMDNDYDLDQCNPSVKYTLYIWKLSMKKQTHMDVTLLYTFDLKAVTDKKRIPKAIHFHPKNKGKIIISYEKSSQIVVVSSRMSVLDNNKGTFNETFLLKLDCDNVFSENKLIRAVAWSMEYNIVVGDNVGSIHMFQQNDKSVGAMQFTKTHSSQPHDKVIGYGINSLIVTETSITALFQSGHICTYMIEKLKSKNTSITLRMVSEFWLDLKNPCVAVMYCCCKDFIVIDDNGRKIIKISEERCGDELIERRVERDNTFVECNSLRAIYPVIVPGDVTMEVLLSESYDGEVNLWSIPDSLLPNKFLKIAPPYNTGTRVSSVVVTKGSPFAAVGDVDGILSILLIRKLESSTSESKSFEIQTVFKRCMFSASISALSFSQNGHMLAVISLDLGKIVIIHFREALASNNFVRPSCSVNLPFSDKKIISTNWTHLTSELATLLVLFQDGESISFAIELNEEGIPIVRNSSSQVLDNTQDLTCALYHTLPSSESSYLYVLGERIKGIMLFNYHPIYAKTEQKLHTTGLIYGGSKYGRSMVFCERAEILVVGTESGEVVVYKINRDRPSSPEVIQTISVHNKPILSLSCNTDGSILFSRCSDMIVAHRLSIKNFKCVSSTPSSLSYVIRTDCYSSEDENSKQTLDEIESSERSRVLKEIGDKRNNIFLSLENIKQNIRNITDENNKKKECEQIPRKEIAVDYKEVSRVIDEIQKEAKRSKDKHISTRIRNNIESIRLRMQYWDVEVTHLNHINYFKFQIDGGVSNITQIKLQEQGRSDQIDEISHPINSVSNVLKAIILDDQQLKYPWSYSKVSEHDGTLSSSLSTYPGGSFHLTSAEGFKHRTLFLRNLIYMLTERFNEWFEIVRGLKLDSMKKIDMKRRRIDEISRGLQSDFNWEPMLLSPTEVPESVFDLCDKSIKINPSSKGEENSTNCFDHQSTNCHSQALVEMMNGELILNRNMLNPSSRLVKEDWMQALNYEDMTINQKKIYDNFMRQLKKSEDEYSKQRDSFEREIKNLSLEIEEIQDVFDAALADLSQKRFSMTTTIQTLSIYLSLLEEHLVESEIIAEQIFSLDKALQEEIRRKSISNDSQKDLMLSISNLHNQAKSFKCDCKEFDEELNKAVSRGFPNKGMRRTIKDIFDISRVPNDWGGHSSECCIAPMQMCHIPTDIDLSATMLNQLNYIREKKFDRLIKLEETFARIRQLETEITLVTENNERNTERIHNLERERSTLKDRLSFLNLLSYAVVKVRRDKNEVDNSIDFPEYRSSKIISQQEIEEYNCHIRLLGDKKVCNLKNIQIIQEEIRQLKWENELLDLKIINSREKQTDIQLLRLTSPVKAAIFSDNDTSNKASSSREADIGVAISNLAKCHEKAKLKLTKSKKELLRKVKDIITENSDISNQNKSLRDEMREGELLYEKYLSTESNDKTFQINMRNIVKRRKLIDLHKAQQSEIESLREALDRKIQRVFPMF